MAPLQLALSWLPLFLTSSPLDIPARPPQPEVTQKYPHLDEYIARETPFAFERAWANIGACASSSSSQLAVFGGFYTWTRDAALTASGLLSLLPPNPLASPVSSSPAFASFGDENANRTLSFLADYINVQLELQQLDNPSGTLEDREGLGEPKFYSNLTAYLGPWGRPQRDGPPLRARAVMQYLDYLSTSPSPPSSSLLNRTLTILARDLDYTAHFWNHTTFDLWEEVRGSSFFTIIASVEALREGARVFDGLKGKEGRSDRYEREARKAACFAREFVVRPGGRDEGKPRVRSNINVENGVQRKRLDANTVLASLLHPTSSSSCALYSFSPCSPYSLSTLHALLRSFDGLYPLNPPASSSSSPPSRPRPLAIGRYAEDTYYGGNPWYLTTLGAAEMLYRAVWAWERNGRIEVGEVDEGFWAAVVGERVEKGTYEKGGEGRFEELVGAVTEFADGLFDIVRRFTPSTGQLDEQFDKVTGEGRSARDLTWSYIAVLTASSARRSALSASYLRPPASPADSEAGDNWYDTLDCPDGSAYDGTMRVRFEVEARTEWGESILLLGPSAALGDWSPSHAVHLSADKYTNEHPVWTTEDEGVDLEGRRGVEYKYVKLTADGKLVWESGENRILYTSSDGRRTVKDEWRD
ncbi:hypothetical protein JCM8097_001025 [Rhodosporidiobolus ruineniae]